MGALLLSNSNSELSLYLLLAIIIVSIMIGVAALVSFALRIKIFFSYWVSNKTHSLTGFTGAQAAEQLLAELERKDIAVAKAGFFRALLYGNHFNPDRNVIYLRRTTYFGSNLTQIGLALQKAGTAVYNGVDVRRRWKLQKLAIFGSVAFVPIVLAGLIIDLVTVILTGGVFTGIGTMIASIIGVIFFILSFALALLNIKAEKNSNEATMRILSERQFLAPDELQKINKVFRTYILAYIADFIISLLELLRLILKIALVFVSNDNK